MAKIILALLMIVSAMVTTPGQSPQERPVWFWFASCGGPLMTLEVRLDSHVIQKSTFPLCRANRESTHSQGQAGRIEFTVRPDRVIVWTGYRDKDDRTAAGEVLEGGIWEAGADPDALTLGVSFMTSKRILMNTVHVAHPTGRDESEIARGLVVRTYPTVK